MHYQLLRSGVPRDAALECAICDEPAEHRLLVSPAVLSRPDATNIGVPRERRGLCRECGRGRHALSFVDDEEIEALRGDGTVGALSENLARSRR
jgi:hypothetical protein